MKSRPILGCSLILSMDPISRSVASAYSGGSRSRRMPMHLLRRNTWGPDALTLTWDQFRNRVSGRARAVKSVLMDQQVLAGIGNIYSDEILFHARIHPLTKANSLDKRQLHTVYKATGYVLKTAIKSRADPTRVPRSWLLGHRESSASCPRCHGPIERITFNQRSTYVCPRCQKKAS